MLFKNTEFAEDVIRIILKTEFLSIRKELPVDAVRNVTAMNVLCSGYSVNLFA
jgi:hypothetical protein